MSAPQESSAQARIEREAAAWIARRDGGLAPAAAACFAAWLAEPAHARVFARHEAAWRRFDAPRGAGFGAELAGTLRARVRRRQGRRRVLVAAASVALIAVATLLWVNRPARSSAVAAVASARIVEPQRATLADGSRVELAPGAVWRVAFTAGERRFVLERGEAHFEVAKDAARPFVVATGAAEIRAVGTAFNVRLGPASVEVLVTEGRVAAVAAAGKAPLLLAAGQGVSLPNGAGAATSLAPAAVDAGEIAERLAWRATRLEFSSTPLHEAVALFNRYSRTPLAVADAETGALEVSGFFQAEKSAAFVRLMETSLGVRGERQGETIVLRRGR